VETLGNLYGSSRSAVFVGAQASEDRAKADMARFRILHFATHGILDGTNPLYSHVVLSQSTSDSNEDGLLEAREHESHQGQGSAWLMKARMSLAGRAPTVRASSWPW
jgi:CHAT domain-containing protein